MGKKKSQRKKEIGIPAPEAAVASPVAESEAPSADAAPGVEPALVSTVAAIDIGANSVRLAIAQVLADGRIEMVEEMVRASWQGHDTFRRGALSSRTMNGIVAILRDFQRTLSLYDVKQLRAVATSAVREASNCDMFLDRVFMAIGIDLEVIHASEESRLTVSAVQQALEGVLKRKRTSLIADVGGGSTLLTVLQQGEIQSSLSVPLGAIRLQEALATGNDPPKRVTEILRNQIQNVLASAQVSLPFDKVTQLIGIGGDVRFAAKQIGKPAGTSGHYRIEQKDFDAFVSKCVKFSPEELSRQFGIPFADAETLNPALLVSQAILHATKTKTLLVSRVTMRDGILLDLSRGVAGQEDPRANEGVLHSALAVAEHYRVDRGHAQHVTQLALRLFDELKREHGLGPRHRLLLEVAGLLHEVGGYVSNRGHHKHSYYLIANCEIFGLSRDELMVVAHVARYHRRSCPKPSHLEYMSLARRQRMIVNRLAALLRVADALDRGHARIVPDFTGECKDDEFIMSIPGVADLTLERRAVAAKGDLFEEMYGMRIRLEEAPAALAPGKN